MSGEYYEHDYGELGRFNWGWFLVTVLLIILIVATLFTAGAFGAEAPAQAPPIQAPPVVRNTPSARTQYDPYRFDTYAEFRDMIVRTGEWYYRHDEYTPVLGALFVGVPDTAVGTYELHCRVPSGFGGLADGVYDCRYNPADPANPVMELRRPMPALEGLATLFTRPGPAYPFAGPPGVAPTPASGAAGLQPTARALTTTTSVPGAAIFRLGRGLFSGNNCGVSG